MDTQLNRHTHIHAGEIRHHQRRYEAGGRADRVDQTVNGGRIVWRQIVRILQIGRRRSTVESERQCNQCDANVRLVVDEDHCDQKHARNDVRCGA